MRDLKKYQEQVQKCSRCKFCQANCPVYLEDLLETHTAGARLNLIQACLLEKKLPVSKRFQEIIDRCLLCTNCVQVCPPNIPADEIVITTRHQLYQGKRRNLLQRKFLKQFMKQRGLSRALMHASVFAQETGFFPAEFPLPAEQSFIEQHKGVIPAEGKKRATVVYFVGCGTNTFYPETAEDVIQVFSKNGIEIIIPEELVCCGLPALTEGDLETAEELARQNLEILSSMSFDAIITDCTSCGRSLKTKIPKLFSETDPVFLKAIALAEKVWEASDYLNQLGLRVLPEKFPELCTYHIPCHRAWSPTVKDAPRYLLSKIPEFRLKEMEYPERCCGAGGTFFLDFKELSQKIRRRKIEDILNTGARIVITQCPSCKSFLSAQLKQHQFMHPLSVLARAYGI